MQTQRREEAKEIMSQERLGLEDEVNLDEVNQICLVVCLCQGNVWDMS